MKIKIVPDDNTLSTLAADHVTACINAKPDATLLFATGNSPLGMFELLVKRVQAGTLNLSHARLIELDEYVGIPLDDSRNLFQWLRRELIDPAGWPLSHTTRFDSAADDPHAAAQSVVQVVEEQGGIDLQVLGIGPNGHIGFNEPGSSFDAAYQVIDLTPESIASSARYWGSASIVPRRGMTLGLGTLGQAKQTILIVSGDSKAAILKLALEGPVTPDVPASVIQTWPNVTVIADQSAGAGLQV